MSPAIWIPLVSAGAAMFGSWLIIAVTIGRWTGRMEEKMKSLSDDMRDIKNDRDLVRWSVLGPMLGVIPRIPTQEAVSP